MKIFKGIKLIAMLALVAAVATGCASKPTEETAVEVDATSQARAGIVDARAAYANVDPQHRNYDQIGSMIADAESALAAGDTGKAIVLANQAKLLAEAAIKEGVETTQPASGADSYTVKRGDSLWAISGKGDVYGNPYQWPLIYKANRDKIKDADLIYPGQQFKINRAASQAEVGAAINHARTRGAWSLGVTEDADTRYLSR